MKRLLTTIIALSLLAVPSTAAPDGLPLPVDSSPSGVEDASGKWRFLAMPRQGRTAVMVQQVSRGDLIQSNLLRGHFVVPAVAYDGSASGLSANGHRLVLIQPRTRFPRPDTTFAVLDARGLRVRRTLRLKGDFSFDALSPDGRLLYLIQYLSRRDPTQYQVRVYDLRRRRLAPEPIVDPREEPGEMYGLPITRAVSPDGRWAYTLYDGQEHPFIHALDTTGRRAVCIDLDALHGVRGLYDLRLEVAPSGHTLSVVGKRGPLAHVDVGSWRVSSPAARHPRGDEGGTPWLFVGGLAALLALGGVIAASRRSRRGGAAARASTGAPASWSDDQGSEALRPPVGHGNGAEPDRARRSGSSARS
jgi:hypothetical protein